MGGGRVPAGLFQVSAEDRFEARDPIAQLVKRVKTAKRRFCGSCAGGECLVQVHVPQLPCVPPVSECRPKTKRQARDNSPRSHGCGCAVVAVWDAHLPPDRLARFRKQRRVVRVHRAQRCERQVLDSGNESFTRGRWFRSSCHLLSRWERGACLSVLPAGERLTHRK